MDPAIMDTTRSVLQPIFQKPKLSDKCLNKPPFRFLHDVFTEVCKATGFGEGLFEGDFLDSRAVKGKQMKMEFLDKVITCVGIALGRPITVRSNKVVAGLEPENTNALLVALGQAATDPQVDGAEAVRRTLAGEQPGDGPAARRDGAAAGGSGGGKGGDVGGKSEGKSEGKSAAPDEGKFDAAAAEAEQRRQQEAERRRQQEAEKRRQQEAADAQRQATRAAMEPEAQSSQANASSGGVELNGDWTRTAELMKSIIRKPPMKEKLLSRPPFRFLHDCVMNVSAATGFLDGLYQGEDTNSKAVKEKEHKLRWLDVLIRAVSIFHGQAMSARPTKIVAGMEADKTNELLQAIALGAKSGRSSSDAVSRALAGESFTGRSAPPSGGGASRAAPAEGKTSGGRAHQPEPARQSERGGSASRSGPVAATAAAPASKTQSQSSTRSGSGDAPKRSRPSTARRRPPKLKENVQEGKSVAPKKMVAGIMVEGDDGDDDDEEEANDDIFAGGLGARANDSASEATKGNKGEQSKLVRDILDDEEKRKRKTEAASASADSKEPAGGGIRMGKIGRRGRRSKGASKQSSAASKSSAGSKSRGAELSDDELEQLRKAIQTLSQSTHPVSKCMDFVHDDVQLMNEEAEEWHKMYREKVNSMEAVSKETDDALQALIEKREDIRDQIVQEKMKINSVKASIAMNDTRISDLLQMVVHTN